MSSGTDISRQRLGDDGWEMEGLTGKEKRSYGQTWVALQHVVRTLQSGNLMRQGLAWSRYWACSISRNNNADRGFRALAIHK